MVKQHGYPRTQGAAGRADSILHIGGIDDAAAAYYVFEREITSFFQTPTPTLTPTVTPMCVRPTLSLGTNNYPLDVIAVTSEGTLPTPGGTAGTAWWISDTFSPFVILLEPGIGSPDAQSLLAQTAPGIAVIVGPQGNAPGNVIFGQRPELINPGTPEPTLENAIIVDISFGETSLSADQTTLQTRLTITNRGSQVITMTTNDLSLTAEGKAPLSSLSVEPSLPQEIQSGGSLSLRITFPNPGGNTAVLRVLDITLDLYY